MIIDTVYSLCVSFVVKCLNIVNLWTSNDTNLWLNIFCRFNGGNEELVFALKSPKVHGNVTEPFAFGHN